MKFTITQDVKLNEKDTRNLQRGNKAKVINSIFPNGIEGIIIKNDWLNDIVEISVSSDTNITTKFENLHYVN